MLHLRESSSAFSLLLQKERLALLHSILVSRRTSRRVVLRVDGSVARRCSLLLSQELVLFAASLVGLDVTQHHIHYGVLIPVIVQENFLSSSYLPSCDSCGNSLNLLPSCSCTLDRS